MYRVSKCGTDIGGAPTEALPYTLALCCSVTSGLLHTKNTPLTGKPPTVLLSGIPVFCNNRYAPPPAPIKTNLAVLYSILPFAKVRTFTYHAPPCVCVISSTVF